MAWAITRTNTVFGNKACHALVCVPDAATFNVDTGLSRVEFFTTGLSSLTTISSIHLAMNSGAGGTALAGIIGASGFTIGDVIHIVAFGPN